MSHGSRHSRRQTDSSGAASDQARARDQANEQQSVMCFVRQWAASTSTSPAPAAGQDVVSGHVGELQPAVAVKFVTPPSAGRADTDNQGHVSNHFGV